MANIYQSYNGHICWLWSLIAIGAAKFESQRSHNMHTKRGSDGYLRHAGRQPGRYVAICLICRRRQAKWRLKATEIDRHNRPKDLRQPTTTQEIIVQCTWKMWAEFAIIFQQKDCHHEPNRQRIKEKEREREESRESAIKKTFIQSGIHNLRGIFTVARDN